MKAPLVTVTGLSLLLSTAAALAQATGGAPPVGAGQRSEARDAASSRSTTSGQAAPPARSDNVVVMTLIPEEAKNEKPVSAEELYKGFRARQLIGQAVYGTNGNKLGDVQDLIVSKEGRLAAVVVEGGGFLDIGDATFRIPFNEIGLTPGRDGILAKTLTEDKAEHYGLYDQPEAVASGPREYRVNELIGDYARLRQGQGYGLVRDVVFDRNGDAMAVLVGRDVRYGAGMFAYPYYGYRYGWDPGQSYYALPFDSVQEPAAPGSTPKVDLSKFNKAVL